MSFHTRQRGRRTAGLVGLLGAAGLLVTAKQLAGPSSSSHHLALTSTPPPASTTVAPAPAPAPGPGLAPGISGPAPATAPSTTATTVGGVRQIVGAPEDNPYGTIQVRVTVSGGRVTDVSTLQSPNDRGRSVEIARDALPVLRQEVLKAQSAQIDVVSGASYDSQGYAQSVQSALDKARA
ncbi:MAG: FMN-binding protein [Actinomycetota bacterium]|nr:FMN-binding protein [Actinomycetota bacterium]